MERFFYATYIETTAEKLWKILTGPEFTAKYWWGRRLESSWKVGAEIKAVHDGGKVDWQGKVLVFEPYTKFSYTFHLEEVPALKNDAPSVVTFEITPAGKSVVRLTVTHEQLSVKALKDVSGGWPAIISSLKSLAESGKALVYEEA